MVQADSGLSKDTELSSLVEEITRRLRTTSLEVDNKSKMEILEEACTRMKTSYHQDCFIKEAVTKGIRNFKEKIRTSNLHPSDSTSPCTRMLAGRGMKGARPNL